MNPQDLTALITASTALIAAVGAIVHSASTRKMITPAMVTTEVAAQGVFARLLSRFVPPPIRRKVPKPAALVTMYDSVNWQGLRRGTDVALYICGRYAAPNTPAMKARFRTITWICVCAKHPEANALDIEKFDATPADVPQWTHDHVAHYGPHARSRLYCNLGTWPAVKAEVASLPLALRSTVRYWVAHPTGKAHVVPGSSATQWGWAAGYDTSTALGDFT